jgi:hypothetical protein
MALGKVRHPRREEAVAVPITAAVMEKGDCTVSRRDIRPDTVQLEDELLFRLTSCGVCGTDKGRIHDLEPHPTPGVLGHEAAGIVEAVALPHDAGPARRSRDDRHALLRRVPTLPARRDQLLPA